MSGLLDEEIVQVPIDRIRDNPHQPRRAFDEDKLQELAVSIRAHGLIQPVVVRRVPGGYELVVGERRLRAASLAGLGTVPAVVRRLSDRDVALLALVENLQREDLDVLEEAEGYGRLLEDFGLTQEELGKLVGKSQSTIANKLRLRKLEQSVRDRISRDRISERHARALLEVGDPAWQHRILDAVTDQGLTVRETERLVEEVAAALARGQEPEDPSRPGRARLVRRVIRDIRIFLNSFQQAVDALREAGFEAEMTREDMGDWLEIRVRVPKQRGTV
ncbi:MAG: ParB/RepB/Spo0J family partition protein [bacterium]|nr:ParB/RepB/Spo0J family partition protein [bacterium]